MDRSTVEFKLQRIRQHLGNISLQLLDGANPAQAELLDDLLKMGETTETEIELLEAIGQRNAS
jgi:hypothetical protein